MKIRIRVFFLIIYKVGITFVKGTFIKVIHILPALNSRFLLGSKPDDEIKKFCYRSDDQKCPHINLKPTR